ncbi:hypothetical protein AA313_de0210244 [Arthrobotrys entomopaga]|nr:hypothetical protein AA313_de0210244 [Arthrobotrys entomopaga]
MRNSKALNNNGPDMTTAAHFQETRRSLEIKFFFRLAISNCRLSDLAYYAVPPRLLENCGCYRAEEKGSCECGMDTLFILIEAPWRIILFLNYKKKYLPCYSIQAHFLQLVT